MPKSRPRPPQRPSRPQGQPWEPHRTRYRPPRPRSAPRLLWTGLAALSVLLVASLLAFYAGQSSGWHEGHAAGYASAISNNADASWASTPNGQRAFALDRLGSLNKLVACSEAGWKVEKRREGRICFPFHEKEPDGPLNGWLIP